MRFLLAGLLAQLLDMAVQLPLRIGHDLLELTAHVGQDVAELVPLQQFFAAPVEPVHEVPQAGHIGPEALERQMAAQKRVVLATS